ncbi:hypothetical protein C9374_000896 [Naegleria lovaniensis]|uniref:RGS domain-containing protein n=1 Tax=Naegleria lovaniensis TaxID=51637 RepID=A0AA88KNW6_NAELO|nr:uncharacterized protein C9374_000896 [Naegleria lovaniensis]KAG2388046.1 hypothetical protein C9374_000896 [Naegleria lovaniensis]
MSTTTIPSMSTNDDAAVGLEIKEQAFHSSLVESEEQKDPSSSDQPTTTTTTTTMPSSDETATTMNQNPPNKTTTTTTTTTTASTCSTQNVHPSMNTVEPNNKVETLPTQSRLSTDNISSHSSAGGGDDILSTCAEAEFICQSPQIQQMKKEFSGTSLIDHATTGVAQPLTKVNSAGGVSQKSVSIKKVTSANDVTTKAESQSVIMETRTILSLQSKATSKTSKSEGFAVSTCCGTVELNCIRVLSIIGMLVNIAAFIAMAVVISVAFPVSTSNEVELLILRADANLYSEVAASSLKIGVYSNITNPYIPRWQSTKARATSAIAAIVDALPEDVFLKLLNGSAYFNSSSIPVNPYEQVVVDLLLAGKQKDAIKLMESKNFTSTQLAWKSVVSNLLTYAKELARNKNDYLLTASSVNLGLIGTSVLFVVPIVLTIFILAINREGASQKRLKKANAIMLLDTMADPSLRQLFRKHCELEKAAESFDFLEKVAMYKEFCNRSYDLQERLFDQTNSSSSGDKEMQDQPKKKTALEVELEDVEKRKYEVAFEIFTEFVDEHGEKALNITRTSCEEVKTKLDHFNTGKNDHLPDDLFDKLQTEIAIVMLDIHQRFKTTLAFQKKMKIADIRKKRMN